MRSERPSDPAATEQRRQTIASEFDVWAKTYETGRLATWYQMHAREVFPHLQMADARRVLDIGCGTGWALRQLAAQNPQIEFHGIDLSGGMIAQARKLAEQAGLLNITFHEGDWEQIGADIAQGRHAPIDSRFDLVLALSSLHYMADLEGALASIRESLYAGGKLVLVDRDTQGSILTRLWGALHKFVLKDGVEFVDTGELLKMMRDAGFSSVRPLSRMRQFLSHGKLFTSIIALEGAT